MSNRAQTQMKAPSTSAQSFEPVRTSLLQRKCACGTQTMGGGQCTECHRKGQLKQPIQAKLQINEPGDVYEQEAGRIADQVLAAPANPAIRGTAPHIQHYAGQASGQTDTAPSSVDRVLASFGRPLEPALRQDMEQRFGHDFSRVRVHSDVPAEQSARDVNAHAYTVGHNVVFGAGRFKPGTLEGRRLIAHELTHVVQQSCADGKGPPHIVTKGAAAIKENVQAVNAPSAVSVLRAPLRVARQPKEHPQAQLSPADRFIEVLTRKPDNAFQFTNDMTILSRLSMKEKLKTLEELRTRGFLDRVIDRFYAFYRIVIQPPPVTPELWAAVFAVKWTSTNAGKESVAQTEMVAVAISSISQSDQKEILDYLTAHSANAKQASLTKEGISALAEGQSGPPVTPEVEDPNEGGAYGGQTFGGTTPPPPSITPEPFAPGNQPVPYYIGNEAHAAIVQVYDSAHPGDMTFYNRIEMSTILRAATRMGLTAQSTALTAKQLTLEPDIANLSRSHLYEIKPVNALGEAIAEAEMYMGLFNAAGIPISLGPTSEDGTRGAFPAPGGVFIFESPAPGAIVYRYRRGQSLEPERVKVTAGEPARARWRYVLKPWQKAAIVGTTVGVGIGLIILAILLSPLGA